MASNSTPKQHLEESVSLAENLIDRCKARTDVKGTSKLSRKIQSELKFLKKLSKKDDRNVKMHLKSTNLVHLKAVVHAMETLPNVTQVIKSFHLHDDSNSVVYVDIVCNNGYTWTKVVARKPKALHLIWAGGGQFGDRSIEEQAGQYSQCASANPKHFTIPQVVFIFVQGITMQLKQAIEDRGIVVQGDIKNMGSELELQMQELKACYDEEKNEERDYPESNEHSAELNTGQLNSNSSSDSDEELLTASELMSKKKLSGNNHFKDITVNSDASYDQLQQLSMLSSDNLGCSPGVDCNNKCVNDTKISGSYGSATLETECSNDAISVSKTGNCNGSFNSTRSFKADCQFPHGQRCSSSNISQSTNTVYGEKNKMKSSLLNDMEKNNDTGNAGLFSDADTSKGLWSDRFDNMSVGSSQKQVIDGAAKSQQTLGAYFSKENEGKAVNQNDASLVGGSVNLDSNTQIMGCSANVLTCNRCGYAFNQNTEHGDTFEQYCSDCDRKALSNKAVNSFKKSNKCDENPTTMSSQQNYANSFSAQSGLLKSQPVINRLNLDITTLISYVSNVCHGFCNFKFREPILSQQACEEREEKLLPKLQKLLEGKELFICETALSDFQCILSTVGGPNEKQRAQELLRSIKVIPDCPSDRINHMGCSAKIKERAKVIFGTGDSLQAMTVTANVGFVRAAEQRGIDLAVYVHPSRALTEQKQAMAEPL